MSGLVCTGLTAGYGRVVVLRELDLEVRPGTVVALLGPNGAGKTTTMLALSGMLPRRGQLYVDGQMIAAGHTAQAQAAGIVLVPDDRSLFTTLTVRENLEVARAKSSAPARDMIELFPQLERRWNVQAGMLSGGEAQMLALARALIQQPRYLLIDEMSRGLAPRIVEQLLALLRRIVEDTGAAAVLAEQHVRLALEVADHAAVLVNGTMTLQAPTAELRADEARLEAAYLHRDVPQTVDTVPTTTTGSRPSDYAREQSPPREDQ